MKLSISVLILLAFACQPKTTESTTESMDVAAVSSPGLEKLWSTDTTLMTSESVLLDTENNVLYVSCIAGVPPLAQDGDGFIAKISPADGSILERQWVTGLDAPKGMGLYNGTLYVTDIDDLVAIDVATGTITKRYPVTGGEFLNDITIDEAGNVYFSDSNTNKIHVFSNGEVTTWAEDAALGGPNGLLHIGDKMMLATYGVGNFNEINTTTKEVTMVVDSIPAGDGVVMTGSDYLVSNWYGEVYYVTSDYTKTKILDTKEEGSNAADIAWNESTQTLYVPTFFGNQVVAYKLNK